MIVYAILMACLVIDRAYGALSKGIDVACEKELKYAEGALGSRDIQKAIAHYEWIYHECQDYTDEFINAAFHLGQLYEHGLGVPKNKDKALEYYASAHTSEELPADPLPLFYYVRAMIEESGLLEDKGDEVNRRKAIELLLKAEKIYDANIAFKKLLHEPIVEATFNLGRLYIKSGEQDKARPYFEASYAEIQNPIKKAASAFQCIFMAIRDFNDAFQYRDKLELAQKGKNMSTLKAYLSLYTGAHGLPIDK